MSRRMFTLTTPVGGLFRRLAVRPGLLGVLFGLGGMTLAAGCSLPIGPETVAQPIGGTYSVTLEPTESGQGLVFRGIAQLRQAGRRVDGTLVLVGGCAGVAGEGGDSSGTGATAPDSIAPPGDCVLPVTGIALGQDDGWELVAPPLRFVLRSDTGAELVGPWRTQTATQTFGGRSRWIPLR